MQENSWVTIQPRHIVSVDVGSCFPFMVSRLFNPFAQPLVTRLPCPSLFKASFRMGLPVVTASLEGTLSMRTTGNTDPCTLSRRIKRRKAFFRSCSLLPNLVSFFGSCSIPSPLSSLLSRLKIVANKLSECLFRPLPFRRDFDRSNAKAAQLYGRRRVMNTKNSWSESFEKLATRRSNERWINFSIQGNGDRIFADVKCQDRYISMSLGKWETMFSEACCTGN